MRFKSISEIVRFYLFFFCMVSITSAQQSTEIQSYSPSSVLFIS